MHCKIKICGITTYETLTLINQQAAAFGGFVLAKGSPRTITLDSAKKLILRAGKTDLKHVALLVNPSEQQIIEVCQSRCFDVVQLHGQESPDQLQTWRKKYGMEWIKALPIAVEADLVHANIWTGVTDYLLFDAKPPPHSKVSGGHGQTWNWSMLKEKNLVNLPPWFLAGGLSAKNIAQAIKQTGTRYLDVSSGVESASGVKDPHKIVEFIQSVRSV